MKITPLILAVAALACGPPRAYAGGGDEGTDSFPAFAAVSVDGPLDAVTLDGLEWHLVDDAAVAEAAAWHDVRSEVDAAGAEFLVAGGGPDASAVEAAVLAVLEPPASAPAPAPDTHPTPPRDEYKLKKTIVTSRGEEKEVYKTLVVEKRSGESGEEFQRRSERELREAIQAGWESTQ